MGDYRYEIKRGLSRKKIPVNAVDGSIGASVRNGLAGFGNTALIENWDGTPLSNGTSLYTTTPENLFGATWQGAVDGGKATITSTEGKIKFTGGTSAGDAVQYAARKWFYADRNSTWNTIDGTALINGIVFETLMKPAYNADDGFATEDFDAFFGLANVTTTSAVIDDMDLSTNGGTATKRIGFSIQGGTSIVGIVNNGSNAISVATLKSIDGYDSDDIVHFKVQYNTNQWTYGADTTSVGVTFYIDGTAYGTAVTSNLPTGEVPLAPFFYVEGKVGNTNGTGAIRTEILGVNTMYY